MVWPFSSTDTYIALKNSCFILFKRLDYQLVDNLPITVHMFSYEYVDIAFSRWDNTTDVCEMVFWFQKLVS